MSLLKKIICAIFGHSASWSFEKRGDYKLYYHSCLRCGIELEDER